MNYMKLWRKKNRKRLARLQRKWYWSNLQKARKLARESYLRRKNSPNFKRRALEYRENNRKSLAAKARNWHRKRAPQLKIEVFSHYCKRGKIRCQCPGCPITHISLLTVDHRKGGGKKHKSPSGSRLTGFSLWAWLKKNRFPRGIQILCWSCNSAKSQKSCCPRHGKRH